MYRRAKWLLMLAALAPTLHARTDDVANERPPMTREALERHWGVDCGVLRQELQTWLRSVDAGPITAAQVKALQLCAAIHNPPGETTPEPCPDYAVAAQLLAQEQVRPDPEIRQKTRSAVECP